MSSTIQKILRERAKTHGDFRENSRISQNIKDIILQEAAEDHCNLSTEQFEALDMIAHKLSRILAGNADFIDHWEDIAGYALLIAQILWEDQEG